MSLHEDLLDNHIVRYCKLCKYIEGLSPEAQADWDKEMRLPADVISHVAVKKYLAKLNVRLDDESVRRHRSRGHRVRPA